ncbi:uncharacterized protein AAG666_018559 [Megaptera novaeangliae]
MASVGPVEGPPTAGISCSPPTIILTGDASSPEEETDKNLVTRAHSPHRRLSHRHLKVSTAPLTSVDPAGHIIDLVNGQLPDISISEEDKKKNLALLEEAKSVSERFLTRRGRKSRSSPGDCPSGRTTGGRPEPLRRGRALGRAQPQLQQEPCFRGAALDAPAPRPLGPRRTEPRGEDPVRRGHLAPYQKLRNTDPTLAQKTLLSIFLGPMCDRCVFLLCQEVLAHRTPVNLTWAPQSLNPAWRETLCVMPECTDSRATLQGWSLCGLPPSPGGPALWAPPLQRSGEAGPGLPLPDLQLCPGKDPREGKCGLWCLSGISGLEERFSEILLLSLWLKSLFFLSKNLAQLNKSECT